MSDQLDLHLSAARIRKAAACCPDAKRTLEILFPGVFQVPDLAPGTRVQVRANPKLKGLVAQPEVQSSIAHTNGVQHSVQVFITEHGGAGIPVGHVSNWGQDELEAEELSDGDIPF